MAEHELIAQPRTDEQSQSTLAEVADAGGDGGRARARESARIATGTVLGGRYRVLEALGSGGMGAVYRVRDLSLDADVAVKVLHPDVACDPKRVESFRNEVRVARKVTHPNVCRAHDLIEADGLWLITMQYVDGESLAERLRREGALPAAECVRLLREIATGLAAAHEVGVVHRDLKPANVLLMEGEGRAIVADFGIAAETVHGGSRAVGVAGTRGYMSPEQAAGEPVDARSDVYSFGVLAHRMLTGALLWDAPTRVSATDVATPSFGAPPDAPPALIALIEQCLAASASDRPKDGAALLARLPASTSGDSESDRSALARSQAPPIEGVDAATMIEVASPPRARRWIAPMVIVGAAAALLVWRPWEAPVVAPAPLIDEIAIAATTADRLAPEDAHLVDALVGLAIAELEDGWGMRGRAAADGLVPRSASRADLKVRLWVGRDRKLAVEATLATGERRDTTRLESTSLRALAADLAVWAVRLTVLPARLRPSAEDLASTCTRSPEAWRLWRRACRESRMQRWSQVRQLAEQAIKLDPRFPLAPLELAFSYSTADSALLEWWLRARWLADACPTLAREWRLAFDAARDVVSGRVDAAAKRVDQIMAIAELEPGERLYAQTRWAFALFFGEERQKGLSMIEWIADEWPTDPAAPKLLANYHLVVDEPSDVSTSLRYARQALAAAPYDVAVRADLARALLANGDVESARSQVRIIERAEPGEKQSALSGDESDNTLVMLRLELGDWNDAERDARRLLLGPAIEQNQGRIALGTLDLLHGAFAGGLDNLEAAHRGARDAGMQTTSARYLWRTAWQAFHAGDLERSARLLGELGPGTWRDGAGVMVELIAARRAPAAKRPAALARARVAAAALRTGPPNRFLLAMMAAREASDWRQVLQLDEEMRAAGGPEALARMYLAGEALAAVGRPRDAEARLERLAKNPRAWKEPVLSGRAWRRLGEIREELGDRAGAAQAYRALIERWWRAPVGQPDVAAARAALARLAASN